MRVRSQVKDSVAHDHPIAYVEWTDACSSSDWSKAGFTDTTCLPIRSVGWLMEDHKDRVVISHGYTFAGDKNAMIGFMSIPKAWIQRLTILDV